MGDHGLFPDPANNIPMRPKGTDKEYVLIIDGMTAAVMLEHHSALFHTLAGKCVAVLCCRLSPIQKARIVHLIKEGPLPAPKGYVCVQHAPATTASPRRSDTHDPSHSPLATGQTMCQ